MIIKIILLFYISLFVFANFANAVTIDNSILSKEYNDIFKAREKQADYELDTSILSTIKPIRIYGSYATSDNNDFSSSSVSYGVSYVQEFFKSGNIWRGIDVAKIDNKSKHFIINKDKRNLIYGVYELVLQIKIIDLDILKQNILLENANINFKLKKEKYLRGIVDIGQLEKSLISLNDIENIINNLKLNKEVLLNKFNNISEKKYENLKVPYFKVPSNDDFISNNNINNDKTSINLLSKNISITKANYMPYASINTKYEYVDNDKRDEKSNTNYSIFLSLSMNIDAFSTFPQIQKAKINALLVKLNYEQSKKEQINFYKKSLREIKIYDNKIKISKQSRDKYDVLINQVKDLYANDVKTSDDVVVIQNTKKIKSIDLEALKLKKNISIISIYKNAKLF